MRETRLTLLSTSILTGYGTYAYEPLSLDAARRLVRDFQQAGKTVQSAIGHQATADLLAVLLNYPVAVNRMEFKQTVDDLGLVFKLKQRAPEGKVLNREEIEAIGYEFGLLRRLS
jgi:Domain of unknown function (DUF1874)